MKTEVAVPMTDHETGDIEVKLPATLRTPKIDRTQLEWALAQLPQAT